MTVLASASGLSNETTFLFDRVLDSLFVRNLGGSKRCLDTKLPQQPIGNHFQVQLAHAPNNSLTGLRVLTGTKRGVLIGKATERRS